jgi:glycosyltransferase involved in cell wall biosynthesis
MLVIDARESGTSTGRYIDKLVEHLHELKPEFDITVLTKPHRINFFKDVAPDFKVLESDFKEFTFAEQLGFLKQLHALKADLVHFSMTQQPVLYKGNVITTIHDLTTVRFNNPSKNWFIYKFKQQVYKGVIRRVAKRSKHIITASEFVKKDMAAFAHVNPKKITVIYEAADKITEPAVPVEALDGREFIMYVGRPTPHKNLERLIEAYSILKQQNPKLFLALAGKIDRNYERIKKVVVQNGLEDSVIFTDFVTEAELKWLYETTAAYVFPSLSEGFGLPGLEAMMHGAPVVSSNATCLPEIYGSAAHYFDPLDVDDMAARVNEVLTDSALRSKLIKAAHAQAAKYSWQATAQQTLEVYKKTLS